MVPATGPVHVLDRTFLAPLGHVASPHLLLETIAVPARAMPFRRYTCLGLLVWWNSKGLARCIRAIAMAFVVFTVLATLGTGEHYSVDLVVGSPSP